MKQLFIPEHKISGVIKSGPYAILFTIQCVDKSICCLHDFALDFMTLKIYLTEQSMLSLFRFEKSGMTFRYPNLV